MKTIKIDINTGDTNLDAQKHFEVTEDSGEQFLQRIHQRVYLEKGDIFFDSEIGIPWITEILKKETEKETIEIADLYLTATIAEDPFFSSFESKNIYVENYNLVAEYSVIGIDDNTYSVAISRGLL